MMHRDISLQTTEATTGVIQHGCSIRRYFAWHPVPTNTRRLSAFPEHLKVIWRRVLRRRGAVRCNRQPAKLISLTVQITFISAIKPI